MDIDETKKIDRILYMRRKIVKEQNGEKIVNENHQDSSQKKENLQHSKETSLQEVGGKEFLVKWKGKSFLHCEWLSEEDVNKFSPQKLRNFLKGMDDEQDQENENGTGDEDDEDPMYSYGVKKVWKCIDRIIQRKYV